MIHIKKYDKTQLQTQKGQLIIEGPITASYLETLTLHEGLTTFRTPDKQKQALLTIARMPEARIIIARDKETIIGYVTFGYPDPLERWSQGKIDNLIELGAIEVAKPYRGLKVGNHLLKLSMMDDAMEDYIIITTEYYWHWDLKGTGLTVWEYRNVMEKMMCQGGLTLCTTDDPEICSHPANCLMVRIGNRVTQESIKKFDRLRFRSKSIS